MSIHPAAGPYALAALLLGHRDAPSMRAAAATRSERPMSSRVPFP